MMLERIARAIKECTDQFDSPVNLYIDGETMHRWYKENPESDASYWDTAASRDELVDYKIIARAVIEAMRSPTTSQEEAGKIAIHKSAISHHIEADALVAGDVWRAMIDEALKD